MSYEIIATGPFERKIKRLAKKYRSLRSDLTEIINSLSENPFRGTPLGKECYKIRIAITSKGKGKSGGARLITYIRVTAKAVYLVGIYDKSEKESISDKELKLLIEPVSSLMQSLILYHDSLPQRFHLSINAFLGRKP